MEVENHSVTFLIVLPFLDAVGRDGGFVASHLDETDGVILEETREVADGTWFANRLIETRFDRIAQLIARHVLRGDAHRHEERLVGMSLFEVLEKAIGAIHCLKAYGQKCETVIGTIREAEKDGEPRTPCGETD